MVDSQYPNQRDDDSTLYRVDDNITEIGGDAINQLRSAVFNIEEALGLNPHGSSADVATRLNQSLNADGTIKASALSSVGLATLPIINSMVASNAGVLESKLDLNYSTKSLRELIGALRVEHNALVRTVQDDITNLSRHVAHPSAFGRHRTSDIDGYIGKYASDNLQGIISDLDTRIIDHLGDPIDAHNASAISFDDTDTYISAVEVQTAIEKLDSLGISTLIEHQDKQHSNGILTAQKAFDNNTTHGVVIVSSSALNTISPGATSVAFTSVPITLSQVARGDRIDITINSTVYTRNIEDINVVSGIVYIFGSLPVGGTNPTAIIYRTTEETSAPSALSLTIRHDTITGNIGGSILQLIHPSCPYILSNGLDPRAITATAKNIKIAWESNVTSDIVAYQALQMYPSANSTPSIWTPENLAIALNEEFKKDANNYPLTAFVYRGEIGIAFDEPDGYLELRTPSSNSAWSAFGLSGTESNYSVGPRNFYIDGYGFSGIRKIVDAVATTDNSTVIRNINADLVSLGVGQTGIVRLKNHTDAGTYVFNSSTFNSLTVSSHIGGFSADTGVSVEIYSDSFAIPTTPVYHTLYELLIDGYDNSYGELRGAPRIEYTAGGGSTANPQDWFNIVEISRDFEVGTKRINFQDVSGDKVVKLGDPVLVPATSTDVINPGDSYTLPSSNPIGHRFRLYNYNNVDYIEIEIASSAFTLVATDQAVDLTINKRISEEKYIQVGQVLHDTIRFKHLSDRRVTGTVGRKNVRSDYSRDYVSYPRSVLRTNGVIYGCEVSGSLAIDGGEVLVGGSVYAINKTSLSVPSDGIAATYNVFVNGNGVVKFLKDDQSAAAGFATPSLVEIMSSSDKVLLAQVDIDASGIVSDIHDFRKFVNNIDNKIELVVENELISHGSFDSLNAVVNYITALESTLPVSKTIKIRGSVIHDVSNELTFPEGVVIKGESGMADITNASKILLQGTTTGTVFTLGSGCVVKDVIIESDTGSSIFSLFGEQGVDSMIGVEFRNCYFMNIKCTSTGVSLFSASTINRCVFENCFVVFDTNAGVYNYLFNVSGNFDSTNIRNCRVVFSSETNAGGNKILSISTGNFIDSVFDNCTFTFPTVSGSGKNNGFVVSTGDVTRCNIENCYFVCTTADSDNEYLFSFQDVDDIVVSNNTIAKFYNVANISGDANRFMFHNNNITEAYTAIEVATSTTNSTISNNSLTTSGFGSANIFDLGDTDFAIISGNYVSITTGAKVFRFTGASSKDVYITDNVITASGSITSICSGGGISSINICRNVFNITGSSSNIIYFAIMSNSFIENNLFSLTSAGGSIVSAITSENLFIHNNVVRSTLAIPHPLIEFSTATNDIISGNIFDVIGSTLLSILTIGGVASDLCFNGNIIKCSSTIQYGINFSNTSTSDNITIDNNYFILSGLATAIMKFIDVEDVVISNNILSNSSASSASGYMMHFSSVSYGYIYIINNRLINSGGSSKGFAEAMRFESSQTEKIFILNNIINEFYGSTSSYGIHFDTNLNPAIVANNRVYAKRGLYIDDAGGNLHLVNNYFNGSSDDEKLVYLGYNGTINIISGNSFARSGGTTNMVEIVGSTFRNNIITNNTFTFSSGSSKSLLYLNTDNSIVSNNVFWLVSGSFSTEAPVALNSGATGNMISNNMFAIDTADVPSGNMIDLSTGDGNSDILNKGQTYYAQIMPSRGGWEKGSNWDYNTSNLGEVLEFTGLASTNYATISLINSDIPEGAKLVSIEVGYYLSGANGHMTVQWVNNPTIIDRQGPIVDVSAQTSLNTAAPGTTTLTNSSGNDVYVDNTSVNIIYIRAVTGSGVKIIYGAKVKYVL